MTTLETKFVFLFTFIIMCMISAWLLRVEFKFNGFIFLLMSGIIYFIGKRLMNACHDIEHKFDELKSELQATHNKHNKFVDSLITIMNYHTRSCLSNDNAIYDMKSAIQTDIFSYKENNDYEDYDFEKLFNKS